MESIVEVTPQIVGANIRLAMEQRQVRLTPLAAHMGVSESTLRRFIDGTHDPSFRQALRMAAMLDYPIEWFAMRHAEANGKVA